MCGRFYVKSDFGTRVAELLRAEEIAPLSDQIYEEIAGRDIFPSQRALTLRATGNNIAVSEMQWGFSNPYGKGLLINARADTAGEKPTFADSTARRRCVIPASGFYEWDKYKSRYRFTSPGEGLIFLAGLYRNENGTDKYTILTTCANDSMIKVHDRMPVMIGQDEIKPWITDDSKISDFLTRQQAELVCEMDSGQMRMEFGI